MLYLTNLIEKMDQNPLFRSRRSILGQPPRLIIGKFLSVLLVLFFTSESFGKGDGYKVQSNGHNQVQIVYADSLELETKIRSKLVSRGSSYRPRTHHLLENGVPRFTNRLILEDSPYLQQHAHNPVNWYPWGKQAFAKAQNEGKPIFLSIGYSTCHWCHVMEKESYDDLEIAEILNRYFVSIKVDRERRPATRCCLYDRRTVDDRPWRLAAE